MENDREWIDFDAQASALESATTQDCATACKALESLTRAAQHICEIAPDHCEAAKARVRSASERVHASCPECEVRTAHAEVRVQDSGETVALASAPQRSGGCAGCAIATSSEHAGAWLTGALLLAGVGRRWRRRHHLRRVRDALRVEPDAD